MNSTKLTISNEKQLVSLPSTAALYPSGTTPQGQPLVYHPDLALMSLGSFPVPDASHLRYQSITRAEIQDITSDYDVPGFHPGWLYVLTDSQVSGVVVMQAVGPRTLDTLNAWHLVQEPQQGGGVVETATPVFYFIAGDYIQDRNLDLSNYARLDTNNIYEGVQIYKYADQFTFVSSNGVKVQYKASGATASGRFTIDADGQVEIQTSTGGLKIPSPANGQDAATVDYVDNRFDQLDTSNLAKLDQANTFTQAQTINMASSSLHLRGDVVEIGEMNADGSSRYLDLQNQAISFISNPATNSGGQQLNASIIHEANNDLIVAANGLVIPTPTAGNHAATKDYVDTRLSSGSGGGDTITGFTRTGTVLNIVTDKGTRSLDLNETTYAGGSPPLLTADPDFQLPFIGGEGSGQWHTTGGWANDTPGRANAVNSGYLFQDYVVDEAGTYRVEVIVESILSGALNVFGTEVQLPFITTPGTYVQNVTLSSGAHRIHLYGNGNFNGVVVKAAISDAAPVVQQPYGYDLFVHKTGDETVGGKKTFTDQMTITAPGGNGLNVTVNGGNASAPVAQFLSPNNGGAIFFAIGQTLNGSSLFGYSPGYAFFTTYGRPATDFTIHNTNGYVGLGTDAPRQRLHVDGYIYTTRQLEFQTNPATPGYFGNFEQPNGFEIGFSRPNQQLFTINLQTANSYFPTGNVGVGTANPSEKMEVVGSVKATQFIGDGSQLTNLPRASADVYGGVKVEGGNQPIFINKQGFLDIEKGPGLGFDAENSYLTLDFTQNLATASDSQVVTASAIRAYIARNAPTVRTGTLIYAATQDGAQTIALGQAATDLRKAQVMEISGSTTAIRDVWDPYCAISGQNLTIAADANIKSGDKIYVKFSY